MSATTLTNTTLTNPAPAPLITPVVMMPTKLRAAILPMFKGNFSLKQNEGLNAIYAGSTFLPVWYRAYLFATIFHETGRAMQPIYEIDGPFERYAPYFGRGLIQVTWSYNYALFGKKLGIPLLAQPDLACQWKYAMAIAVDGMTQGLFTGKKFSDFLTLGNPSRFDAVAARRIINGTDQDELIAGYYATFLAGLTATP
jgi:hypothetical protein